LTNSSCRQEELLACVIARLIAGARHVAVGAASPIPATAAFLLKEKDSNLRISLLQKRKGNPFTEGSRELFDLAGQGRIDVFFLGGAQIDGEGNVNLVQSEGRRFPGSFGSAFMYQAVKKVILFREEHSRFSRGTRRAGASAWSPSTIPRWPTCANRPASTMTSARPCAKPSLPPPRT
jgi:glutaconate CoA-transferase, subunit B